VHRSCLRGCDDFLPFGANLGALRETLSTSLA
jgi:hypothetical protein